MPADCCQCACREVDLLRRELFVAESERDRMRATNAELVEEINELRSRDYRTHCHCQHRCK